MSYINNGTRYTLNQEQTKAGAHLFFIQRKLKHFITEMGQGLLVPRPGGHSSQVLISGIGKEDVQVCWAVHFEDIFQLLDVQVGPGDGTTDKQTVCGSN